MTPVEAALLAIARRSVYDIQKEDYPFVNKLIYWGDDLMILGFTTAYHVADYGKTWKLGDEE